MASFSKMSLNLARSAVRHFALAARVNRIYWSFECFVAAGSWTNAFCTLLNGLLFVFLMFFKISQRNELSNDEVGKFVFTSTWAQNLSHLSINLVFHVLFQASFMKNVAKVHLINWSQRTLNLTAELLANFAFRSILVLESSFFFLLHLFSQSNWF